MSLRVLPTRESSEVPPSRDLSQLSHIMPFVKPYGGSVVVVVDGGTTVP